MNPSLAIFVFCVGAGSLVAGIMLHLSCIRNAKKLDQAMRLLRACPGWLRLAARNHPAKQKRFKCRALITEIEKVIHG